MKGLETTLDGEPHCKAHGDSAPPTVGVCGVLPHQGAQDTLVCLHPGWELLLLVCRDAAAPDVQGRCRSRCSEVLPLQMCRGGAAPDVQGCCCSRCAGVLLLQMCRGAPAPGV